MIALVLIGPTASGKTTLAKAVARELGIERISSGDIARSLAESDAYTRAELTRGDYAPELAMREEIKARIEAATVKTRDFVIEGFPRKLEQLYILESFPEVQTTYFVIELDALICIRRLIKRGREDDHPDAVATRFRAYQEDTEPMIEVVRHQATFLDGMLPTSVLGRQVLQEYLPFREQTA